MGGSGESKGKGGVVRGREGSAGGKGGGYTYPALIYALLVVIIPAVSVVVNHRLYLQLSIYLRLSSIPRFNCIKTESLPVSTPTANETCDLDKATIPDVPSPLTQ